MTRRRSLWPSSVVAREKREGRGSDTGWWVLEERSGGEKGRSGDWVEGEQEEFLCWRGGGFKFCFGEIGLLLDKLIVVVGGTGGLGLSGERAIWAAGGGFGVVGREGPELAGAGAELGAETPVIVGDA